MIDKQLVQTSSAFFSMYAIAIFILSYIFYLKRFPRAVYKKIFLGQESEYLKNTVKKKFLFQPFFTRCYSGGNK
jgi:hypothetical protein